MWTELLSEAESGNLWIKPSKAIEGREATEHWLQALRQMRGDTRFIGGAAGFPDLPSARQLAAKFDRLAFDRDAGLTVRLDQFIEVGEQLSELLLLSIRHFEEEDDAAASNYLAMHGLSDKQPSELKARYQELTPVEQPR
ncbi:hypothetical protein [Smaragdicoccus niigatensis]|uniref:hypothetical protein n=1 Tax=Smaragdicoccus niigatensis TaxID=359359 RepID=UPI00036F9856|nr:hypothetical protein [Smaragdicoccus niigatensis]